MTGLSTSISKAIVRPLRETELSDADRIFRVAFGTFVGLPQPEQFAGDTDYIGTRWKANPAGALGAEVDGKLAGTIFGLLCGSVGYFGPLTIDPSVWDKGIGQQLVAPTMEYFRANGVRLAGLFTFSNSAKHLGLYQKFGFHPQYLTAILGKPLSPAKIDVAFARVSALDTPTRDAVLSDCRALTDELYEGFDLTPEIAAVQTLGLGDTVVLTDGDRVEGFAVCHLGAGTEAGSGNGFVKFAAVRPGPNASGNFANLLLACESLALSAGATTLVVGVNTANVDAYRHALNSGYRTQIIGVGMQTQNEAGCLRPNVYFCGDWR